MTMAKDRYITRYGDFPWEDYNETTPWESDTLASDLICPDSLRLRPLEQGGNGEAQVQNCNMVWICVLERFHGC